MKRGTTTKDWLPLARTAPDAAAPTGEAFQTDWIDFERGIRVGRLEPHERITQILKHYLETTYRTRFVTDRWGRGMYWQWICWVPRVNREAKPISHDVNFSCAKVFISPDQEARVFQSGLQIERGWARGSPPLPGCRLKKDWDWHRLMKQCAAKTALDDEIRRLVKRAGFAVWIGGSNAGARFTKRNYRSAAQIRAVADKCAGTGWAGFQLYYPMSERELKRCTGYELVKAICGVFREVVPAMNTAMQVQLVEHDSAGFGGRWRE
ncbi:MAG: hypothetical protein JXR37_37560 [Kiritimatiellae bacterium]|nr:hypothetical protein [Kiritimatiellia bacterium]